MAKFKVGDKVRIIAPKNWVTPPGFRLADAEGTVDIWVDWPEAMDAYNEYIYVKIDKATGDGKVYEGTHMHFKEENLKKI